MTVSLCIIAYNEEKTIQALLDEVKAQTYPHERMEIILADSMSTDSTPHIMRRFYEENTDFCKVVLVKNRAGNQAGGWNTVLRRASKDIIIRVDAHASIPEDFVAKNVRRIEAGEDVVGGQRPCIMKDDTPWKQTLLLAESSMFGSSIAVFRRSSKKSYVKSVFHPAYRREVFDKVGFFNENLGRTEDNEMSYRIRKAGYRILYDPDIISWQFGRDTLRAMLKQKYGNGYWIGLTSGICPECLSLYYFIPFCFLSGIGVTSLLAACNVKGPKRLLWGVYASVNVLMSLSAVWKEKKCKQQLLLPVIFLLLHLAYGAGTLIGLVKMPHWRKGLED